MLFKKTKEINKLLEEYLIVIKECFNAYDEFLKKYFECGSCDETLELSEKVGEIESKADTKRHLIIREFLNGAFLPEIRGEMLKMIEFVDEIANNAEEIVVEILYEKIKFTEQIKKNMKRINEITKKQLNTLNELIQSLFIDFKNKVNNQNLLIKIDDLESEIDKIERDSFKKIFDSNVELAQKNQLKGIISKIADISDLIEDTSDMLEIILVMRKV